VEKLTSSGVPSLPDERLMVWQGIRRLNMKSLCSYFSRSMKRERLRVELLGTLLLVAEVLAVPGGDHFLPSWDDSCFQIPSVNIVVQ
jgi:hypothetical protein